MKPIETLPTLSTLLLDPQRPYIHRDLSWIQFNDRVLTEARILSNPLLKRLKFISITSSNLDEFFMIRFASLLRSLVQARTPEAQSNLMRVHASVVESVRTFGSRQKIALEVLRTECRRKGIFIHLRPKLTDPIFPVAQEIFQSQVLPQLQSKNDFRFSVLSDLANLQMLVYVDKDLYFEVPKSLPTVFTIDREDGYHCFFLDDLILTFLLRSLPLDDRPGILRITRDADFTVDLGSEDTESIPDLIKKSLGSREKGRLVRLQYSGHFPKDFLHEAMDFLKLDPRQCYRAPGTLCLHSLFSFANNAPPAMQEKLGNPPLATSIPPMLERGQEIFEELKRTDIVLHHPYDSFEGFILWLEAACLDPKVTMIEQTIYRTDSVSRVVDLLKKAAATKKIRVTLELRARFDEFNNLKVAEDLKSAGVEVRFGFGNLKLHAKITLVTRKEGEEVRRYTHLSTGNYNAKTARQYTDISILTANQQIGEDARYFFNALEEEVVPENFQQLVTAPTKLHQRMRQLIKQETEAARQGKKARIFAKVNALVDEKIIEDLYVASQAGVVVELVVRGACSLIPGVKGLSENIKVISIVDRFLEHSRIYFFENSGQMYLSSADWMPRNFFSRLEIAFPILDERIYKFIVDYLIPGYMKDNVKARKLTARGKWEKISRVGKPHQAQEYFQILAKEKYQLTPLPHHWKKQKGVTAT